MKLLIALLACIGFVPLAMASEKPVKVKIVKTDTPSRNKPWYYRVVSTLDQDPNPAYKSIKRDDTVSFTPGTSAELHICTEPKGQGTCWRKYFSDLDLKGKQIAIDAAGTISARTADEIKKMIAETDPKKATVIKAENPVKVTVLIPTSKFKVPFVLISAPSAINNRIYDRVPVTSFTGTVTRNIGRAGTQQHVPFYKVSITVPGGKQPFYLSIDNKPGRKVILRDDQKRQIHDEITEKSIIRMGTSENVFFVEDNKE